MSRLTDVKDITEPNIRLIVFHSLISFISLTYSTVSYLNENNKMSISTIEIIFLISFRNPSNKSDFTSLNHNELFRKSVFIL